MARVFVAGHNGMVGAAIVRALSDEGHDLVTAPRRELDLADRPAVTAFLKQAEPQLVVVAAAKVGGIHANDTYPAEFIFDNLLIESHLIEGACQAGCNRLLFLGSSCIYPKMAEQPMREDSLLTGPLEPTNEPYAIVRHKGVTVLLTQINSALQKILKDGTVSRLHKKWDLGQAAQVPKVN